MEFLLGARHCSRAGATVGGQVRLAPARRSLYSNGEREIVNKQVSKDIHYIMPGSDKSYEDE